MPSSGRSTANRSRIWRSTGISRAAHSIRRRPSAASDGSLISKFFALVVIYSFPPVSRTIENRFSGVAGLRPQLAGSHLSCKFRICTVKSCNELIYRVGMNLSSVLFHRIGCGQRRHASDDGEVSIDQKPLDHPGAECVARAAWLLRFFRENGWNLNRVAMCKELRALIAVSHDKQHDPLL